VTWKTAENGEEPLSKDLETDAQYKATSDELRGTAPLAERRPWYKPLSGLKPNKVVGKGCSEISQVGESVGAAKCRKK